MIKVAGLTGGIASGKSTVSKIMARAGAAIVDADLIAHQVVEKGRPAWDRIRMHFGNDVLLSNGEIDRKKLGKIIFSRPEEKFALNRIVHPFVFEEMNRQMADIRKAQPRRVIIFDVPLLFETGMHESFSPVILVYVPEHVQLQRLMCRDNSSREDAMARIRSQMSIEEKKKMAPIVIDNSGTIDSTKRQALSVYRDLKSRSSREGNPSLGK